MKPISRHDAAKLSLDELHGLFRQAFNALANAERGTQERRDALASLEAIEAEIALRLSGP
ncbi:MAG: hypothetical protein AAGF48_13865 [Pseudomonadota bacterium]